MPMLRHAFTLLLVGLMFQACSPLSDTTMHKVDRSTTFAMVNENPAAFLDRHLLLVGTVLSLESSADGGSTLEVLEWRLTPWGEPLGVDNAGRRFLVKSPAQLDPDLYQTGRLVTLTGSVLGSETRFLGENPYQYPVFALDEIHLWKSPYRYGIHPHPDPQFPYYVGPEDAGRSHPYDPGYYAYPYTPYWYRVK